MDGISGAAAVIGLVQAATQVTTALGRYVSSVKGAESSRAKLLEQIKLISAAEKAMEAVIRNSPRSSREPELQALMDGWFKADGFPSKCKGQLEKLSHWLERQVENRKQKKWGKMIVWPIQEDKIQATIRAFEGNMPYFRYIVAIESLSLAQSTVTTHRNNETDSTKLKLLKWLDGFDCTDKHENTREQRQKKTGGWLFKEQLYIAWRECSTKFLWLHGKAGAGKSVLASAVIDDLCGGLSSDEPFAYFYCDFRNPRCTNAMEVLRSLVKQLLINSKNDWLPSFSDLATRMQHGSGPPTSLATLSDLLERAAELQRRPIIVVDALDECEDLPRLLSELVKLSRGHCRLFVTSRTLHNIEEAFTGLPSISLEERVDEVRDDMCRHIKMELESRSRLKILEQNTKDEIESALMRKAGGMFRWVQCQLDRLNECCSLGDVREVLNTLPATLYETYDQMLRAIDKKSFGPSIARRALTWLVTALEPLRLSQLAEAISISHDKPDWDTAIAPMHESVILDILDSLVSVDHDDVVTLSHYSVKEYLTSETISHGTYYVHRSRASLELATISIFSLVLFSDGPRTSAKYEMFPLLSYADHYGFRHLADCHSDHNDLLVRHLLTLQNHISLHRLIYQRHLWYDGGFLVASQLALNAIICFGHLALLRCYLDSHPVQATEENHPLTLAALNTDVLRVQLLLVKGLDVNHQGPIHVGGRTCKMTPLTAAARNVLPENQESLVQLLLENGCLVPSDAMQSILLCDFGTPCTPAVVRVLLEHGADPQLLTAEGRSCLHLALAPSALADDQSEIARMLVAAGCDPMAQDIWGLSSFHLAIGRLSLEFVQWLVQRGCRLPSDALFYPFSDTFFHWDATKLPSMLQFLVRNGADAGVQGARGCNALHHFSRHIPLFDNDSIESVLRLLVKHGCDINCQNDAGETPLHLAATSHTFDLHILGLFLTQGAELPVDIVNYVVRGSWYDRVATVTSLVKNFGASCRAQTTGGDNALHCLMRRRIEPEHIPGVVSLLVENGCSLHALALSGETPLQLAIENGYFSFARSILAQLTEPYSIDRTIPCPGDSNGNVILHRASRWFFKTDQFDDKAKLLREAGYDLARDINRPNNKGFTPLCIALMNPPHDPGGVSHLLALGASFCHVNPLYLDHIEWATDLPWYRDATDASERSLSRSKINCDDVTRVYHLLRVVYQGRPASTLAKYVLDMAEYWACMKTTMNDVRHPSSELVALPTVPGDAGCWIPRRVLFACKAGVFELYTGYEDVRIRVYVRRAGLVLTVPVFLHIWCNLSNSPRTEFGVWDEFTPAVQECGRQRLMVGDLLPGDTLIVKFDARNDYFTLEFFQIEVYYAMKPFSRPSSGDL